MGNVAIIDTSPVSMLSSLPGWEALTRKDQISVEKDTKALAEAFQSLGRSRLAIGEHLTNIHERIGGTMFSGYIEAFHFKRSTAFKAMKEYKNAVHWLPEPVLRAAMRRNMPIMGEKDDQPLGIYTDHVKRLPPTKSEDPVKIDQYLDSIEESRKRSRARSSKKLEATELDFDVVTMEAYRFSVLRIQRLSNRRGEKRRFLDKLVGLLLTEIGVSGKQTFEAEAIPDGYRAQVGRPRNEEVA